MKKQMSIQNVAKTICHRLKKIEDTFEGSLGKLEAELYGNMAIIRTEVPGYTKDAETGQVTQGGPIRLIVSYDTGEDDELNEGEMHEKVQALSQDIKTRAPTLSVDCVSQNVDLVQHQPNKEIPKNEAAINAAVMTVWRAAVLSGQLRKRQAKDLSL